MLLLFTSESLFVHVRLGLPRRYPVRYIRLFLLLLVLLLLLLSLLLLFIIIIFIINNAFVVFYLPTLNLLSLLLCTWDGSRTDSTPFVLKLTNCQRKWIFYLCRWPTRIKKISTCPNQVSLAILCLVQVFVMVFYTRLPTSYGYLCQNFINKTICRDFVSKT